MLAIEKRDFRTEIINKKSLYENLIECIFFKLEKHLNLWQSKYFETGQVNAYSILSLSRHI